MVPFPSSLVGFLVFHPYMHLLSFRKLFVTCSCCFFFCLFFALLFREKRWEERLKGLGRFMVYKVPYSGKFSNGANFRIIRKRATCAKIKTFENLFWMHVSKKEVERVWKVRRWHFIVSLRSKSLRFRVRTALCLVLSLLLLLKMPTRQLSSVPISVLKLPQSQKERTPSLPLKTKQPLPNLQTVLPT